jgi:aspartate aminotransferase
MVFSEKVENMQESPTLALNAKAKERAANGLPVFNLTAGEPDIETPKFIVDYVAGKRKENKYTPAAGMPELRQMIARYYRDYFGQAWVEPANVTVTAGAKPALTAIFTSILNNGDEVIVPKPAWVSYRAEIEIAGGRAVFVPTKDDYDLNVEEISHAINPKTKAIIINSPNNPSGAVYSRQSLNDLAELLTNKDIFVISDDIYSRLVYTDLYLPLHTAISKDKLVIINGFSKSQGLTGWRIGYIISSKELQIRLSSLLSHTNGNAPVMAQHAAVAALKHGDKPDFLPDLEHKRQFVDKLLSKIHGIKYKKPAGGFYYFVDIRQIEPNSELFCQSLLQKYGVVLVPGEAFEMPGFFRLSYATNERMLKEGINKLTKYIKETK